MADGKGHVRQMSACLQLIFSQRYSVWTLTLRRWRMLQDMHSSVRSCAFAQVAYINHAQPEPFPAAPLAAYPHGRRPEEHRAQVSCPHTSPLTSGATCSASRNAAPRSAKCTFRIMQQQHSATCDNFEAPVAGQAPSQVNEGHAFAAKHVVLCGFRTAPGSGSRIPRPSSGASAGKSGVGAASSPSGARAPSKLRPPSSSKPKLKDLEDGWHSCVDLSETPGKHPSDSCLCFCTL